MRTGTLHRLGPLSFVGAAVLNAAGPAWGADSFAVGQHIQVREGDAWTAATVTGREGRRYHIHYDGSSAADDEWVATDRMRTTAGSTDAPTVPLAPTAKLKFSIRDDVEVKRGGLYRKATVVNTRGGWYFIEYGNGVGREWVESDRVRAIGSTDDPIGWAPPHNYRLGDGPPPGPSLVGPGNGAMAPTGHRAIPETPDLTRPDSVQGPGGAVLATPDLSGGKDLSPVDVVPMAGSGVDPEPSGSPPHMLSLNHGPPQAGTQASMLVTPQGRWAALAFRSFSSVTMLQRVELGSNDAGPVVPLTNDVLPLAISPDGKRVVTRSDRRGDARSRWRLDVWDVDRSVPKNLLSFRAFDPAPDGADGVEWAAYVDATHLMVCSVNQMLTLWQVSDGGVREVYTLVGDGTMRPRLSGGGTYVVAGFGGKLVVCDALTGACVARASDPDSPGDGVALRGDLKRLALSGGRRLVIVDLEGGGVLADLGLPANATGVEVGWIGPDLLLIDDRWIYDVAKSRFAWEYQPAANPLGDSGPGQTVARTVGNRIWLLMQSGNRITGTEGRAVLSSAAVPDPLAQKAIRQLDDGLCVIKPGETVSLEVNLSGVTDGDRAPVTARFKRQLADAGYTVADGQAVKLVVQTRAGQSRQGTYHDLQSFFGTNGQAPLTETVTATQTVYDLSWQVAGKAMWSITSTSGGVLPYYVVRRANQSYADAVGAMNKPTLDWFLHQHIPREVLAVTDAAGQSPLTGAGATPRSGRVAR